MQGPDGMEQREADRLERDTYDHDAAADRADEQNDADWADLRATLIAIARTPVSL